MSGLRSSPSTVKRGGLGTLAGGTLAGPLSATLQVGGSGGEGRASGRSGGCLPLLDLAGLSGVSWENVPGSDCYLWTLEGALVGV